LEPGAILPVQFYPAAGMRSEKRLMLAILEDALEIHRKYAPNPGRRHERLVAETERWLLSDDTAWPVSFLNVCSALGIDAAWLRAQFTGLRRARGGGDGAPLARPVRSEVSEIARH
jgi:hypothetical protein